MSAPLKDYVVDYTVVKRCAVKAANPTDAEVSARYLIQLLDGKSAKLLRVLDAGAPIPTAECPPATPRPPKPEKRPVKW